MTTAVFIPGTNVDAASPLVDYMRRCDLSRMSAAERQVADAMYAVEKIPAADVRLTEAISLLAAARVRLADYVDGIPGHTTHPVQPHLNTVLPTTRMVQLRDCACCSDQPTVPPDCPACKGVGGFSRIAISL